MKAKPHSNGVAFKAVSVKRITIKGKRLVQLEEAEFERLMRKADLWEPLMPEPDEEGNYPAVETLRLSIAIDIIRYRRRLGLSQVELARRAGIRPESLNRIELGHVDPSIRTIEKIDQALRAAEAISS